MKMGSLPTQKRYKFKVKVERIVMPRQRWNEAAKKYEDTTDPWECAVLVPVQSAGMEMFLNAWLPQSSDRSPEVVVRLGEPIYLPGIRTAPRRPNQWVKRCHLFVMSEPDTPVLLSYRGRTAECESYDELEGEEIINPTGETLRGDDMI